MSDEILAFTDQSRVTDDQLPEVMRVLSLLDHPREARYGTALGVDTLAQAWGLAFWEDTLHRLYVPAGPHNRKIVDPWRGDISEMPDRDVEIIDCPDQGSESYRLRNQMMLAGATRLIAFVKRPTYYRSGEWMTINLAERNNKIPVEIAVI